MVVSHPDPESMIRDKYHHYNQLMANNFQTWEHGPNFDTKLPQNVTAIQGKTTMLICRVIDLGNKTVSQRNNLRIVKSLWLDDAFIFVLERILQNYFFCHDRIQEVTILIP